MSLKQIAGIVMILAVFIGIFVVFGLQRGFSQSAQAMAFAVSLTAWIGAGAWLMADGVIK